MKSLKYWLSFLSLILLLVIPCGGFYYLSRQPGFDAVEFVKEYPMPVCIGVVIWAVLFKSCTCGMRNPNTAKMLTHSV